MLLRTWEGWLQQRGKWDFVGKRAKANWERMTPNTKKCDSIPCQFRDDDFIWFTAFNACQQHTTILSITTHTTGQVHFLSGHELVFSFLEPSEMLAPHKAGSAEISCASLLHYTAFAVPETSAKPAQISTVPEGLLGRETEHCPLPKTQQKIKDVGNGGWWAKYIKC